MGISGTQQLAQTVGRLLKRRDQQRIRVDCRPLEGIVDAHPLQVLGFDQHAARV